MKLSSFWLVSQQEYFVLGLGLVLGAPYYIVSLYVCWFQDSLALPPSKDPLLTIGHELWGRAHVGYSENFGMTEHSKIYISVYKKFKCDITALC